MTMLRPAAILLLLMLSGCAGSLLAPQRPVALYRLEGATISPAASPTFVERRQTIRLRVSFAAEIDDDRLLAIRGRRAMYLKSARWIASTPELFRKGIEQAFARRAPWAMLDSSRQPANIDYTLELRVDHFEAVYAEATAADAPPVVRLDGEARLFRGDGGVPLAAWPVAAQAPANQNRIGAIVDAFGIVADGCFDQAAAKTAALIAGASSGAGSTQ
ncbi:membrane integrity-associated transporter subunit PqiC [Sphingopyxis indica]|uniref:ABC-type transport auxiliary lipoprotein family protein n=1 Tax=Sphingopyxis indica TaxID=436663 RepID=UPI002939413F|nr:ABC-type transport auxiliary lipoprotein family protein [Sphingopyxis indica]WOF45000.1 membrane integrity-associated transporter subunit PqiC [Sphingopyxis indica]